MDPTAIWQKLVAAQCPIDLDVPLLVRKLPDHSRANKLVLEVLDGDQHRLGSAAVFPGGWYPGAPRGGFSHYFSTLDRALAGLEAQGREPVLRLQLLKSVNAQWQLGRVRPFVVLLKFVVAPEFAIAGSRVEQVYQCPLAGFYRNFLNLGHDALRDASKPSFVSGQAIHRGYAGAARRYLATEDDQSAAGAYLDGVVETWIDLFPYLLLDRPRGGRPTNLYQLPVEAVDTVVGRCRQLYQGRDGAPELLQERLFFSPARGISGKADRIVQDAAGRELWELKTKTGGWAVDKDPRSGRVAPGGIQALAYHEILRTLDGAAPRTFVELLDPSRIEGIPLEEHPVVTRAQADVAAGGDRYVDLVAQARNVAYVVESGLLTGYDRERLASLARQGSKIRAVGSDFDLYGSAPPCGYCPAGQRGLCESSRQPGAAPWFDFFRHVPDLLFEYWAWFHGQLKQAENLAKERLFHLVTTPASRLERDEGICVADLDIEHSRQEPGSQQQRGRPVALRRARRIETRLREDDRVLVTRMGRPPGELHSVEATIRGIGHDHLLVDLREPLPADPARYRVDQLGFWDRGDWQLEGLTDFLVGSMQGGEARGRRLDLSDLPRLARVILGEEQPRATISSLLHPDAVHQFVPHRQQACHPERQVCHPERQVCHPERSEGSADCPCRINPQILRCAQDDKGGAQDDNNATPRGKAVVPCQPSLDGSPRSDAARELNDSQTQAIQSALSLGPGDMLLIQGPPGTGKTTMIAHLVRRLVARDFWRDSDQPRPVLVLANTHRACNEVVVKLHRRFPDLRPYLVRLGPVGAGMEPEVREHVLGERLGVRDRLRRMDLARDGPAELVRLVQVGNALHDEGLIFVGTLAGANRPELRGLEFSTIVVDECGQATEPAALQALRHAVRGYRSRLILVGDHRQLPPVVPDDVEVPPPPENLAAAGFGPAKGLRVSLFERLATRHPDAVLTLAEQYRMSGPISELVSETFYDGRLRPGDARVAEHHLGELLAAVGAELPADPFVASVLEPSRPVVLVDTSRDSAARDTVSGFARDETRDNPREAEIIADLLAALLGPLSAEIAQATARQVGVISPYRKQNNRIRQELLARLGPVAASVRVDTVDRFQGGECELILLSLVASNPAASIGALHADWRRMNVAISRAKAKLVVVGDRRTFTAPSDPDEEPAKAYYRRLFDLIDRQVEAGRALIVSPTR